MKFQKSSLNCSLQVELHFLKDFVTSHVKGTCSYESDVLLSLWMERVGVVSGVSGFARQQEPCQRRSGLV